MGKNGTDMYGDDHFSIETRGDMGYPHFRNPNVMTISYYIPPGLVLQKLWQNGFEPGFSVLFDGQKKGHRPFSNTPRTPIQTSMDHQGASCPTTI